ncbi:hypothetical protein [Microbacterium sp. RU33B]|uniref:hypothetical protein n=1 Tax=Microbacterium sp. RU33B TaxID=1907390 RepID=UPI000968413E|nr:hypothetical protein [Microbacterium sp. RU33B]SIT86074.1 hypothetical protein SAMN05880545_2452 [Microbacterium sp. RU33B]
MKRVVAVLAATLMISGGLVLVSSLAVDYIVLRAYALVFVLHALGFAMIFAASLLARDVFTQTLARVMVASGSALWLLCWSGFLIGNFVPIPLALWASLASAAYSVGAVACVLRHERAAAVIMSVLAVSSTFSTVVMLLAAASLVSPDFSYAPFAIGAVIGGALLFAFQRPHRILEADRRVSAAAPPLGCHPVS